MRCETSPGIKHKWPNLLADKKRLMEEIESKQTFKIDASCILYGFAFIYAHEDNLINFHALKLYN